LNRAVKELAKIASSGNSDRVAFSSNTTYDDLRKLLTDKLWNNKDILSLPMI
jgi:hypothetical protein